MKPSRRNPAVARRVARDKIVPARLTRGHHDLLETKRARSLAARLTSGGGISPKGPNDDVSRWPTYLGRGNFGHAYTVPDGEGGALMVKLPTDANIHQRPWTYSSQRQNIMHEVGIANELRAKGITVVPRAVYVEVDGTPMMVREYGDPVIELTGEEYGELERQLLDVERKHRFRIHDELTLYRRADGTVFVGDVGVWDKRQSRKPWRSYDSDLSHLLAGLTSPGFSRGAIAIAGSTEEVRPYTLIAEYARTGFLKRFLGVRSAVSALEILREREARGIPSPPEASRIRRLAERAIASEQSRPNGARRKTPRRMV
jgi:hypothetical protein